MGMICNQMPEFPKVLVAAIGWPNDIPEQMRTYTFINLHFRAADVASASVSNLGDKN